MLTNLSTQHVITCHCALVGNLHCCVQASVIELYDASHHDLSIESIILGRTQHSTTHSSYGSVTLEVLTQSFYLQHFIKGLSVTQTKQGITTKQLLVQTVTDQVSRKQASSGTGPFLFVVTTSCFASWQQEPSSNERMNIDQELQHCIAKGWLEHEATYIHGW